MTTITRRMLGASASVFLFAASLAAAQTPETLRVGGTIESVDGPILNVRARDGENAPVRAVVKASLGDVKVGSYLALTSVAEPDGSQKALAVLILPEALRDVAEGSIPWDFVPNSRMTNAAVDSRVASVDGQVLVVKYQDSDQKIVVPPTFAAATAADLKPSKKNICLLGGGGGSRSPGGSNNRTVNLFDQFQKLITFTNRFARLSVCGALRQVAISSLSRSALVSSETMLNVNSRTLGPLL